MSLLPRASAYQWLADGIRAALPGATVTFETGNYGLALYVKVEWQGKFWGRMVEGEDSRVDLETGERHGRWCNLNADDPPDNRTVDEVHRRVIDQCRRWFACGNLRVGVGLGLVPPVPDGAEGKEEGQTK